jgi:ABC-type transport system involved in multi-copper enzyme maturation permease subunit
MGKMDKRKLRLVLLGVLGIIILVIGIKAVMIYGEPMPSWAQDELIQSAILVGRNTEFTEWIVKWIVIPFCIFLILTAALVVSRVISNKIRPPSGPSGD